MKYVFYHIFYPAKAPKSAEDLISFAKSAVGTEMSTTYYEKFKKEIRRRAQEINEKGKINLNVSMGTVESGRTNRNGVITISSPRKWGTSDIVRLSLIRVDHLWTENTVGKLVKVPFEVLDGMKDKAGKGGQS